MALCLGESLLAQGGFDPRDQMGRYLNWWKWGYLSSTGTCFDIGMTVRDALERFERTGEPYSGSIDARSAGNGSLMRLAPVALFYAPNINEVVEFSARSSRTTHGAPEAMECCRLLGFVLARCLVGNLKHEALDGSALPLQESAVVELAGGSYLEKSRDEVRGSGYAVASLEAALWCFHTTTTFEAAVLDASNLGEDADTGPGCVLIVEARVVWDDPSRWMDHGVAKLKFNRKAGEWRLFWQRASLRWESYEPLAAHREFSVLVEEIDRDPHGCFFG